MEKIKITFIIFLLSIFLEGVVRKWIMPSIPATIAFSFKYIILLLLCFYLWKAKCWNILPSRISNLFKCYTFIVLIWAFLVGYFYNGPIVAIIASIQYCVPIAIVYTIVYLISEEEELKRFLKLLGIIMIPVFILAFIQYISPPHSLINRYGADETKYIAMVGNSVRVSSVFSYITPFGDCCVFVAVFSLCMMTSFKEYSKSSRWFISLLFLFSLIGGFMSGARMVVGLLGIYTLFIVLYMTRQGNFKFLGIICILALFFTYAYSEYGFDFVDNFLKRVDSSSDDTQGRIGKMLATEKMFGYGGVLGYGTGFTSNALQSLLSFKSPVYFEEELGRLILEFGALGTFLLIGIRLFILKFVYNCYQDTVNSKLRSTLFACFLSIIPMSIFLQLCLYNWFAYMCYYIFIGLSIAIYNIDNE